MLALAAFFFVFFFNFFFRNLIQVIQVDEYRTRAGKAGVLSSACHVFFSLIFFSCFRFFFPIKIEKKRKKSIFKTASSPVSSLALLTPAGAQGKKK